MIYVSFYNPKSQIHSPMPIPFLHSSVVSSIFAQNVVASKVAENLPPLTNRPAVKVALISLQFMEAFHVQNSKLRLPPIP
jgi:hypothetical protein